MIKRISRIVERLWMKIRHPSVKTAGKHHVRIGTEIIVIEGGTFKLGSNVSTQKRVTFSVVGGTLNIGDNTSFNRNDIIVCHNTITIGKQCAFGPNVVIYDHDHIYGKNGIEVNQFNTAPITIEDKCWIGANVTILRGTKIGAGSVIGAGAIIKGTIPPGSIVKSNRELIIKPIE